MIRCSAIILKTKIECKILEISNPSRLLFVDLFFPHKQTNNSIIFPPVQLQEDWILRTYARSMAFNACSTWWRWIQPGWGKTDRCLFQATSCVSWGNKFLVVRTSKLIKTLWLWPWLKKLNQTVDIKALFLKMIYTLTRWAFIYFITTCCRGYCIIFTKIYFSLSVGVIYSRF